MVTKTIPIKDLSSSKNQVRTTFNEEKLDELALSLKEQGQEVPIKVRPHGKGYEIIYGHRRTEASRRAGLKTMIAIVEDVDDMEALRKQVVENECREKVPDVERVRGYKRLMKKLGCTKAELGKMVGYSEAHIRHQIRALEAIDNGVTLYDAAGEASVGKTVEVLGVKGDWNNKSKVADKLNSEKLNRQQVREVIKAYNTSSTAKERKRVLQVKHPKRKGITFNQAIKAVDLSDKRRIEKRHQSEVTDEPIVKNYLDAITVYRDAIKEARESSIRFAPEAIRFVSRRHNLVTKEMLTLKEVLENE